ncbi:MAG: hypothetical protein J6D54_01350 [Olsenella sp.]|nr:hypothetical protein [Olsenella sp.]
MAVGNILWSIAKRLGFLFAYSDEELKAIRDEVQEEHRNGSLKGTHDLERIDRETERRKEKTRSDDDVSTLPKREHGWYVNKD